MSRAKTTTQIDRAAVVPRYYSAKTADILYKYGPGPRVHFHVGLFDRRSVEPIPPSAVDVRQQLVESQEAMLRHAAAVWRVDDGLDLLDVGCGLGGGAIYWAQRHDARVTALTNAADHVPLVRRFATEAGVVDQVSPVLFDAHEWWPPARHDAAVALESSGYLDRPKLFAMLARALRPGGWFGVEEHFVRENKWASILDAYYKTCLGTADEYAAAAAAAGFTLEADDDVTDRVVEFWTLSRTWTLRILESSPGDLPIARSRLIESARMHARLADAWREHAVETRLLLFRFGNAGRRPSVRSMRETSR